MNILRKYTAYAAVALSLTACAVAPALPPEQRPLNWAQPVGKTQLHQGLPNLFQVSPVLYRSAQPTAEGLNLLNQNLAVSYGLPKEIKTVVNLRNNEGDGALVVPTGVRYEQIPFDTWQVKETDVVRFLKIVRNPNNQPVLLHCKHGADRTGMMTAIYRIVEQGWRKQDAIAEMTQGGFGYHPIWSNLIRYIEHMDVADIQRKVTLTQ
jgi:protein tyrosine/serine phosphatase